MIIHETFIMLLEESSSKTFLQILMIVLKSIAILVTANIVNNSNN